MSDINCSNKMQCGLRFVGGFIIIVICFSLWFGFHLFKQSKCNNDYLIINTTYENHKIIDDLMNTKISENRAAIILAIELLKLFYNINIGEYEIKKNSSLFKIMRTIALREKFMRKICLYEGCSIYKFINILKKNKFLLGEIENMPMEGYLMPDTYIFTYPTTRQEIIDKAKNAMDQFLKSVLLQKNTDCYLKTPHEILTLASIIEKETSDSKEKVLIAGVYINRLKINMKLQSCPTVIYAIKHGDSLNRKVLFKDLFVDNIYNTYINIGLPPAPIANPGKTSILAVLNPEKHDYLFFVCGENGKHIFSQTFEEHKKNKICKSAKLVK